MTSPDRSPAAPVRVAFVMHVMQVAGAEMLVAEIIRRLGPRLAPLIVCLEGIGQLGHQLQSEGVKVVALGRRPGLDVNVSRRLGALLQEHQIEVVHAHQYTPFFYSALAKLVSFGRWHLLFTEHGRHYPDVVSTKRRLANRLILSHLADDITAVCAFSATSLSEIDGFVGRTVTIIENGIDDPPARESREVLRQRLGLSAERQYVVCVARFHPVKDHKTLLQAFAIVAAQRPDTDLLLAGDGDLRTALEQQARDLGLDSRVRFLGVRDDVPDLLHASDVFALSSVSEASSLTLLQAMAARLPSVATAVGGNPEIIRHGTDGLLVPRQDPGSFADALLRLLSDSDSRAQMGASGRRRVEERYRLDQTVQRYYERYLKAARRAL